MTTRTMQPIPKLADYCGDGNPVITWHFKPGVGWKRAPGAKRASTSWLGKLRREGITHVSVEVANRPGEHAADFSIEELTTKTGLRG